MAMGILLRNCVRRFHPLMRIPFAIRGFEPNDKFQRDEVDYVEIYFYSLFVTKPPPPMHFNIDDLARIAFRYSSFSPPPPR